MLTLKFREIENAPKKSILSPADELCEKIYSETFARDSNGRFPVALPFRDEEPYFSDSREVALNNFLSLERRLLKNSTLHKEYSNFLQDLNHMELVTLISNKSFYIPHHCVYKPNSISTRLRVVFNASSKINNVSLIS